MSNKKLTDADFIRLIGTKAIMDHFDIRPPAVSQWKKRGIPKVCRKPLIVLGESLGHDMTEMKFRQTA